MWTTSCSESALLYFLFLGKGLLSKQNKNIPSVCLKNSQ